MIATRISKWTDSVDVWTVAVGGVEHRVEITEGLTSTTITVDGKLATEVPRKIGFTGAFREEIDVGGVRLAVYRRHGTVPYRISNPKIADRHLAGGSLRPWQGLAATVIALCSVFLWKMSNAAMMTTGRMAFTVFLGAVLLAAVVFLAWSFLRRSR